MKKLLVAPFLVFLAWGAVPAYGNSIQRIDIRCDAVSVGWESFPARPVDLTVTLSQHSRTFVKTVSTDGQPAGEAVIPANFDDGPATVTVEWHLMKPHPASAETVLRCTETTTTIATSTTSTTTSATSTSNPPTSPSTSPLPPPEQCGENTLACTGSSSSAPLLFGFGLVALGAVFMALNRRGSA